MKTKICLWSALLLTVVITSCREESDVLQSYAFDDKMAFEEAKNSYAGKFKVLWKALDQNYGIWDYERSYGLDWDAVYDEFLPLYEALDERKDVSDADLKALLEQTVAPLHDGHFVAQMHNHQTGNYVLVSPSNLRVQKRDDYGITENFTPHLEAYYPVEYEGNGDIVEGMEAGTDVVTLLSDVYNNPDKGYQWAKAELVRLAELPTPTDLETFRIKGLMSFITDMKDLLSRTLEPSTIVSIYNQLVAIYDYLEIPGLEPINSNFATYGIKLKYALFRNNVAYFYLSDFSLSAYLDDSAVPEAFPGANAKTIARIKTIRAVWQAWFDKVQSLHASGQLRGVIIDVRNNSGGMFADYAYVLGSLLPSGGIDFGHLRFKRGLGRYDYSPLSPFHFKTLKDTHSTITEPIVVLANCRSVSMAEVTALTCKNLSNGYMVGKHTHGGICGLKTDHYDYSTDYAGIIGTRNETPVWLYIPVGVTMDNDKNIYEGIGVAPDIEVDFDANLFTTKGRDSQLERALQFLSTGH